MTSPKPLLLLVEDEPQIRRFLRPSLSQGFRLLEVETFAEGLAAARRGPELILLDLGLPDGDGVDFTRRVRAWSSVPIIVISARGRDQDKAEALDAGADDYLTKPFGVVELLARIRVAFRHAAARAGAEAEVLAYGALKMDLGRREVKFQGHDVHLTPIEYKLLELLARNAGRVVTHRQIIEHVWGPEHAGMNHYVVVRMAELRKKIESDPRRPRLLITEPGIGYRLRDAPPDSPIRVA
jgi:two-component system KDP operon response regulator KdpE